MSATHIVVTRSSPIIRVDRHTKTVSVLTAGPAGPPGADGAAGTFTFKYVLDSSVDPVPTGEQHETFLDLKDYTLYYHDGSSWVRIQ